MREFDTIKKHIKDLFDADSMLSSWLLDNTQEVYEEQPEIDEARLIINESASGIKKALHFHIAGLTSVKNIVTDYLQAEMENGFTEFADLEDAIEILSDVIEDMDKGGKE